MSKITWLHISDLHFKTSDINKWDQDIVLRALLSDLKERLRSDDLRPGLIMVSGDIAFSGVAREYELAEQFFDELLKVTNLPKTRLFIVPGNHDVDRSLISRGAVTIASSLDSRNAIAEVISTEVDRRLVFRKFERYAAFVNNYLEGHINFDDERFFYVNLLTIAGRKVAVLGLNTAWLAMGDKDRGSLALGERQVRRALESAKEADIRVGLFHHPFDWLNDFDRNDCEPLLMKDCDFVLHGHLHRTSLIEVSMPDAGAMVIAAGACYETRDHPNNYSFVTLDFETGKGHVLLRRYSDEGGGFWTKDVMTYRNVNDGLYTFDLSLSTGEARQVIERKKHSIKLAANPALLEDAYLRRVKVLSNALPLAVIDPRAVERTRQRTIDLSSVYVALNTETQVAEGEEFRGDKKPRMREGTMESGRETRPLSALEAAAYQRQIVLLGDPGSGKTTFAKYLALCMAGDLLEQNGQWLRRLEPTWPQGSLLPLKVTLREFAASEHCDGTAAGLLDFINEVLAAEGVADFAPFLRERLLEGGVLMLLDGLDEVSELTRREAVRDAVENFVASHNSPSNRFLVTCRGYAYQDPKWQMNNFCTHTIASLQENQIDEFIRCWYKEICQLGWKSLSEAEELTRRLQAAIRRPDLMPLARNPLQLTMMASLHFSWGRLPDDRAELYQEMVRLLLDRWQGARLSEEVSVTRILAAGDLESAIEQVAFMAHRSQEAAEGPADVTEAQLRSVLKEHLEGSWDKAGELVAYIKERAGLLIEKGPGIYTFPHRSYQEYLAGSYLAVQPEFPDEVASLARENYTQWRQVALWAVGIMAQLKKMTHIAVDVISALCPREVSADAVSEDDWRLATLAGEALLEIGLENVMARERHHSVMNRVQGWLVQLLKLGRLAPLERAAAGDTLSRLGDPRFKADAWYLPDETLLGFVAVESGPFLMGSDKAEDKDSDKSEIPQHEVDLPTFYMARYPVTFAQFQTFVKDSGYKAEGPWKRHGKIDTRPVLAVTWYDAMKYCQWMTDQLRHWKEIPKPLGDLLLKEGWQVRLPTEAEWEKAARGTDGRKYPWIGDIGIAKANYDNTAIGSTSVVGCFPEGASPYEILDMSGNVWEWTHSLWGEEWDYPEFKYRYDPNDDRENESAGPHVQRVLRGGAFYNRAENLRCAVRAREYPKHWDWDDGFRVVVAPALPSVR